MGVLEEPFGNARLHAVRLMAALLYTRAPRIHQELCRLNMINLLLDLFFKFSWNNFLHVQVEHCVSAILNQTTPNGKLQNSPDQTHQDQLESTRSDPIETHTGTSDGCDMFAHSDLIKHLIKDCRLVQRILDAWEENDKTQEAGGMRKGYMGHLTRIANTVVHNADKEPEQTQITELINELPENYKERWEHFVNDALAETNKRNTADLVFSDYQIQQMTANFVDQFGLNDDEFGEHDGSISATFDRITEINFNLVDEGASSAIFETRTKEKIRHFDEEEEEDIWEEKEINYAARKQVKARSRFGQVTSTQNSEADAGSRRRLGSPDLEWFPESKQTPENAKNRDMDNQCIDPQSPGWIASFEDDFNCRDFASIAMDTGSSVWGSSKDQLSETNDKGWATFGDFQPFCCSDAGPRCSSPVDSQNPNKQSQNDEVKGSSACVWSVCGARKAPLVASDSSSSGTDSEEEEERTRISTDTVATGNTKEPVKPSVDFSSDTTDKATGGMATDVIATATVATPIAGTQSPMKQKGDPSSNGPM
ncbi:serine/threonine-protein phosphatase 6 regulatory subunit 2-like [Triplophysa rosa]|nr:serine/threonine-protein phosphatase 6 regulatory subunit 2-like [Triplophysa rosa]KAI7799366.1 putative serine/threonine-protein phosphatase 6 regulatory subunit 2 [Triplophysa rosa]